MNQMQHDFGCGPVAHRDYGPMLGTPFKVFLSNGISEHVDTNGKILTEIVDLPGLIGSIVQTRALHPWKLSGADLRYIRSALCMKAKEVADVLELTPEHYSRCEAGVKTMSADKEKFYRMYIFLAAYEKDIDKKQGFSKDKFLEIAIQENCPEKIKEAFAAFRKIFFGMKLICVRPVGEEIALCFGRHSERSDRSGDEESWRNEANRDAA